MAPAHPGPIRWPPYGARHADMSALLRSLTLRDGITLGRLLEWFETKQWFRRGQTSAWHLYETSQGVPATVHGWLNRPGSKPAVSATKDEVGEVGPVDWLGTPIEKNARVVWPCEDASRRRQMATGFITEVREDGVTVEVVRRSLTGRPRPPRDRRHVHLTLAGMHQMTVLEMGTIG